MKNAVLVVAFVLLAGFATFQAYRINRMEVAIDKLSERVGAAEISVRAVQRAALAPQPGPRNFELARDISAIRADIEYRFLMVCVRTGVCVKESKAP